MWNLEGNSFYHLRKLFSGPDLDPIQFIGILRRLGSLRSFDRSAT